MKKVFFTVTLLFVSFLTMNAQDGERTRVNPNQQNAVDSEAAEKIQSANEMADKETARQNKRFRFTPEQIGKAKAINLNYCQQRIDATTNPQGASREETQNKLRDLRTAQMDELKTILTYEQQAKWIRVNNPDAEPEEKIRSNQPQPNNRARNRNN